MSRPPDNPDLAWSAADAKGLLTCRLTPAERATLKGRRLRKAGQFRLPLVDAWPGPRRALLIRWLKLKGGRMRHDTLLKKAGTGSVALAEDLLDELLHCGALEVEEDYQGGLWRPTWLRFLEVPSLAHALGLPNADAVRTDWEEARRQGFIDPALQTAANELAELPAARALVRLNLLRALERWQTAGRSGTWRDFAQLARGDTKGITEAEKDWLSRALDMESLGISGHEPLLYLAAPLRLGFATGEMDVAAARDFLGLTPKSLLTLKTVQGDIAIWHLVENRTSFERVARQGVGGTIWLPGFLPTWWRRSVGHLLHLAPAAARIACDPDPAGLEICAQAGALWRAAGLEWEPWHMAPADLDALPVKKPLSELDRARLDSLIRAGLPHLQLTALARHMLALGEKGEQEGGL